MVTINETRIFAGEDVNLYVLLVLKSGLKLYSKTGIKPNRAWTITNMLRKAGEFTGKVYKRGSALTAIKDLEDLIGKR